MTSRRNFLKTSALSAAALLFLKSKGLSSDSPSGNDLKFGFISGIIGKELKGDWQNVLRQTVEFGFSEIETGNFLGESAESFMKFCRETGLTPVAGGVPFTDSKDELNKRLDELSLLGIKYPVVYWPWTGGGPFMLEDCKKSAEKLNKMGDICKSHGKELLWHNHDKEFAMMEEGKPFDYLMAHTDESLVKCELDVFWSAKGGTDAMDCLTKYSGRFRVLHLKDMTGDDRRTFECVGKGIINFPEILKESRKQGIKHYMVEFDNVEDGLDCLRTAGSYLKSLSI